MPLHTYVSQVEYMPTKNDVIVLGEEGDDKFQMQDVMDHPPICFELTVEKH